MTLVIFLFKPPPTLNLGKVSRVFSFEKDLEAAIKLNSIYQLRLLLRITNLEKQIRKGKFEFQSQ